MIRALLKKQLLELGAAFVRSSKTGKRRSRAGAFGYALLFAVLLSRGSAWAENQGVMAGRAFWVVALVAAFGLFPLAQDRLRGWDGSEKRVADELAKTEEFEKDEWTEENVLDLIAAVASLAQLAEDQDQSLFLVIRPLEMTEE